MLVFRKIWRALFSWNTRFEIRPFALLLTTLWIVKVFKLSDFYVILYLSLLV